jgi:23S rRNA pseudouridine1911/1915/1917 synthase
MRTQFTTTEDGRLDKIISENTKLSRKRARKIIEAGGVRVDGRKARLSSQHVSAGAQVELQSSTPTKTDYAFDVCYKDEAVLVVNKPSGLASQPMRDGRRSHLHGMVQAAHGYAGLHHRLDTPASGLMLFTMHKRFNPTIAEGFRTHSIQRTYQAVLVGDPGDGGRWDHEIDGKSARTHFRRLSQADGMSLIEATLETGRTHQIRVHATQAGHPIVGDQRHGGAAGRLWPRLALHATQLGFNHPQTGERITVKAPLPADLAELWRPLDPDHQYSPVTEAD